MAPWRRIGCAVDFSEASRAGLESAAGLAARLGAELFVIHVSEERAAPSTAPLLAPPPVSTRVEKHGAELEAWVLEAERLGAAAVRSALLHGRPAAAIIRFAAEEHLDLLVVGSHGHGGLRHLVLGSVTEEAVRAAPCPVLVVRASPARP
jgi:nucleotide-binding universal stress UspA family protein